MLSRLGGRLFVVAVAALVVGAAAVSCSSHDDASARHTTAAPTTHRPRVTPRPTHQRHHHRRHHRHHHRRHRRHQRPQRFRLVGNPLTGLPGLPSGPVIGVKIDDTAGGRPQSNIDAADVVYVEQAEGGLTRLLAVYATHLPRTVGPVRSVRRSDPELLAEYGRPTLAFSGGAAGEVAAFHRSIAIDGSATARGAFYSRTAAKPMPYNLMVNLAGLSRSLPPQASGLRDIGLRWAWHDRRVAGARITHGFTAVVGQTPVSFGWDPRIHRWVRQIDGAPTRQAGGRVVSTPNVVVQFCKIRLDARDVDTAGNPSAYTQTVGSGPAMIFRNGRVLTVHWVRPRLRGPTHYVSKSGRDIPLHPGGAWILLAGRGSHVAIRH